MKTESTALRELRRVLLFADLTGYMRAGSQLDALQLAEALARLYASWQRSVTDSGGRVVKFMGDACLAVFPEDGGPKALECATALTTKISDVRLPWDARVNVALHCAVVAEGYFAEGAAYDVVGSGVNYLFTMMKGGGIRLSEPVYRQLPNELRGPWHKEKPPAVYVLEPNRRAAR
jgi:class 3 adenylate cyclase